MNGKKEIEQYIVHEGTKEPKVYASAADAAAAWFHASHEQARVIAKFKDGSAAMYAGVSSVNGVERKSVPREFQAVFNKELKKEIDRFRTAQASREAVKKPEEGKTYTGPIIAESRNFYFQKDRDSGSVIAHEKLSIARGADAIAKDATVKVRYPHGLAAMVERPEKQAEHAHAREIDRNRSTQLER